MSPFWKRRGLLRVDKASARLLYEPIPGDCNASYCRPSIVGNLMADFPNVVFGLCCSIAVASWVYSIESALVGARTPFGSVGHSWDTRWQSLTAYEDTPALQILVTRWRTLSFTVVSCWELWIDGIPKLLTQVRFPSPAPSSGNERHVWACSTTNSFAVCGF